MRIDKIVAFLMILTGFCSFGYELVLHYEAVLIVGSSTLTMGLIISMFIFGYLSSFFFGRLVDRLKSTKSMVVLFCLLEVGIALLLVTIVPLTRMVPDLSEYLGYIVGLHLLDKSYLQLIMISILALIIPLLMGGEIPTAMKIISNLRNSGGEEIGRISGLVFAMDSLGAGAGGLTTAIFLIPMFGQSLSALILSGICLVTASILLVSYNLAMKPPLVKVSDMFDSKISKKKKAVARKKWFKKAKGAVIEYKVVLILIIIGIVVLASVAVNVNRIEYSTIQMNYEDPVVYYKYSRYQQIVVVENPDLGYMLYLNGQLQIAEEDEYQYHEPLVHVPLIVHPNPTNILIIGGGDGGALEEVLKHDTVQTAVMVELDQEVVKVSKKYFGSVSKGAFDDPRTEVVYDDGRKYIEEYTGQPFDVVICDLPHPETETVASLYTVEFYRLVKDVLAEDGIMVTQSTSPYQFSKVSMSILKTVEEVYSISDIYATFVFSFGTWSFCIGSRRYAFEDIGQDTISQRLANRTVTDLMLYSNETHFAFFEMMENAEMEKAYDSAEVSTIDKPLIQERL